MSCFHTKKQEERKGGNTDRPKPKLVVFFIHSVYMRRYQAPGCTLFFSTNQHWSITQYIFFHTKLKFFVWVSVSLWVRDREARCLVPCHTTGVADEPNKAAAEYLVLLVLICMHAPSFFVLGSLKVSLCAVVVLCKVRFLANFWCMCLWGSVVVEIAPLSREMMRMRISLSGFWVYRL